MGKNKPGYSEAIAEIEEILAGFESGDVDVDMLADRVRRAAELIKLCRQRLRKAEEDVREALKED